MKEVTIEQYLGIENSVRNAIENVKKAMYEYPTHLDVEFSSELEEIYKKLKCLDEEIIFTFEIKDEETE